MIARMDQLTVVGRRSIARDLLQSLQSLGVVQVDPLEPDEGAELVRHRLEGDDRRDRDRWAAAVSRIDGLQDALGVREVEAAARSDAPTDLDAIETYLGEVGGQVDQLLADRAEVRDERELVQTFLPLYRLLAPTLAQLEGSRYLAGTPFLIPADDLAEVQAGLDEALEGRQMITSRPYGGDLLAIAVTLEKDRPALRQALSRFGISPLALPGRYAELDTAKAVHVMEERSQTLPKRQAALSDELDKLAAQHGARLRAVGFVAHNHLSRLERLEDLLRGRYGFALRGWVPAQDATKVVEGLRKQFGDDVVVATRAADEHHDHGVPVKLDNPGWIRPFQGLLSLFAPPKYGNFDPSWTLAVFFPLFFGIVVGDIAFGLLFLTLGLWLQARGRAGKKLSLGPLGIVIPARNLPGIGTVINWCAGWTILFGVVYGEFFGNFLEHWPHDQPVFYPGDKGILPILLFRVEVFTPLLLVTIGFGVLQVLGGWVIRAYYGWKHDDRKHLWEGIGMFSGLLGLVIFATAFLYGALSTPISILVAALLAVFVLGVILSGIPLMIVELISNSGNILSYLRLFAVGLSAALVANLATDLGFAVNEAIAVPAVGEILGIVVALIVHLLAITLTIIGHTLQPLRLQYVEFFTKFGFYEESGRPYQPFKLIGGKA